MMMSNDIRNAMTGCKFPTRIHCFINKQLGGRSPQSYIPSMLQVNDQQFNSRAISQSEKNIEYLLLIHLSSVDEQLLILWVIIYKITWSVGNQLWQDLRYMCLLTCMHLTTRGNRSKL